MEGIMCDDIIDEAGLRRLSEEGDKAAASLARAIRRHERWERIRNFFRRKPRSA